MKHIILTLVFAIGLSGGASAQEADIKAVINSQLKAFQADDFEGAFTHASPFVKQIFRTPSRFGQMVVTGYPMVHRPASVLFKQTQERGGTYYQYVFFEDQKGAGYIAEYAMIETENGWKINGVDIKQSNDVGL